LIWLLYNLVLVLAAPFWVPWMLWRSKKRNDAPNWLERTGNYPLAPREDGKRIWLHAVSVGEVLAAQPIIPELRKLLPDWEIVLSCTTSTGHAVASGMLGKNVHHVVYFPIDVPRFCMAALLRVRPGVVAIMETELWLNFTTCAKSVGAKLCLANGRISDRSFARAKFVRFFYRRIFQHFDKCLMQTEIDRTRALYLGAKNPKVVGNSKYDQAGETKSIDWKTELSLAENERLIVVGSARGEMEEDLILNALRGLNARIVFAPRHIERAQAIAERAGGLGFQTGFRSSAGDVSRLLILDTFGELSSLYAFADIAVIGGGFDNLGGQNLIQPMAAGCPVVCGPHMRNFREPFEAGLKEGAVLVASTAEELSLTLRTLLSDKPLRERMGAAGRLLVTANMGAARRYAMEIAALAEDSLNAR
jgi:3-deoxy-D-manno-octulosonic-acid transferase